jgi:predicted NBD/HSP70 family sugar kinase
MTAGLRDFNRERVLSAIRMGTATSRVDLVRMTGLARSTIAGLVADLIRAGIVVEERVEPGPAATPRSVGRPPLELRVRAREGRVVGIDFGHSHVTVGIGDLNGRLLGSRTAALNVDSSPGDALARAARDLTLLLDELSVSPAEVVGAAMGLPAPVDVSSGRVRSSNILPAWIDWAPGQEFTRLTGLPVLVENDANLGAIGEINAGAAVGLRDVVYVKVATGIGAGLVLDGTLFRGARGTAGEIGHQQVIESGGAVCRCGNRGCLETAVSTVVLPRLLEPTQGPGTTLEDLVGLVNAGDVGATRLIVGAGRMIGRVLANLCNALDPQALIIGGELGRVGDPLLAGVRQALDEYGEPDLVRTLLVRVGALGAQAELLGALVLAGTVPHPAEA